MSRRSCGVSTVGMLCSSLFVTVGTALIAAHVFPSLMHNYLKKRTVSVEGSSESESWKSPKPPVFREFFFFNITNVEAFLSGAKPQVTQVGPYTYRYKDDVNMVENGTNVSQYKTKSFVFLREKSVGDPSEDHITTVNIPVWDVMNKVKGSFVRVTLISVWMNSIGSGIFTTRTVDELLWGYEDPVLERIARINPEVDKIFGLMLKKNRTNSGEFVYQTGEQNYLDYGRVVTWEGQSHLTFWTSNQSNSINGSDGSAFHPLLDKSERINVFTPDFCRPIYMEFEKEVEVKGIPVYRFTPPRSAVARKEENPANESFCDGPLECLGSGLLNVSPCHGGAPVVASFPHFYLADEKYVAAIDGMSPQKIHHQTFLDINPMTGVIVRANRGAQVNILVNRMPGFIKTKALKDTVFPVMFYNEKITSEDDTPVSGNEQEDPQSDISSERTVSVEHSPESESWKSPSTPVFREFFFFNLTNVDAFLSGAKPQVTQVGPYTYRYKDDVNMVENGTKVSAYNTKSFVFLREKSVGDPSEDHITTVNIPVWDVMNKVKGSFVRVTLISVWMNSIGSGIFTTRTVDELLWGYEDPLLEYVARTNPKVDKIFGLMVKKNKTNSGEFVSQTGEQNYLDYGRVVTWKGQSHLTFWTSNQSNSINGSDGSAFHPLLDKSERIYVFTPDFCRPIYMEFEKEVEVKGIPVYRFTPPRSAVARKEENPANDGPLECLGSGLLNVSPCHGGAPVVASFPHFYLADEKYVAAIEGMSPEKIHHQTFLDINPTTGVIVRANRGAQVNILVNRIPGFIKTKALNDTVFPVMFYNEKITSEDDTEFTPVR